jgi:hypothetical protein
VKGPTPRRLKGFAYRRLGLQGYFKSPGDGRVRAHIRAETLLWALIIGHVLRDGAYHAIEALVRSPARRALGVSQRFGDDTLGYFTERVDPEGMRQALARILQRAKRNKAFENRRLIGLALDGTGAARSVLARCSLCRPFHGAESEVVGHNHRFSLASVVGTGFTLPFDVEGYGLGDSELGASRRLLERAIGHLGKRFADYVVADGEYAGAPFLHGAAELGLRVVVRLKENLPELLHAAEARFRDRPPAQIFENGKDRVEIWDAGDFDPWESLRWQTVRVLRYRQIKPDGRVFEAYWLTDFPVSEVGSRTLYTIAKSRWEIENQAFNDAKNRYGLETIRHHHENSLIIGWLVCCLAMVIERLYRLRYLNRGGRPHRSAIELLRQLWLALGAPLIADSS